MAIVGSNGQGKTNLVEALGFLSTLGSHRVSTTAAMIGVCSAVLMTMVQPVANTGASFHTTICSGAFHGRIAPTTPTGVFVV